MKEEEAKLKLELDSKIHKIGNIVHDSVTPGKDEEKNDIV